MNNDAGWNGSGGPWVKPEESMQKVVWPRDRSRPARSTSKPRCRSRRRWPASIATSPCWRFPPPGNYRIADIQVKAAFQVGSAGPAYRKAADCARW